MFRKSRTSECRAFTFGRLYRTDNCRSGFTPRWFDSQAESSLARSIAPASWRPTSNRIAA